MYIKASSKMRSHDLRYKNMMALDLAEVKLNYVLVQTFYAF
jgi:hypothetical protein